MVGTLRANLEARHNGRLTARLSPRVFGVGIVNMVQRLPIINAQQDDNTFNHKFCGLTCNGLILFD